MNFFYLGSSCIDDKSRELLSDSRLIVNNATQKREKYIFSLVLNSKIYKKINFISFGLGKNNGFYRKEHLEFKDYKSIYLGYIGSGKLRYISGIFSAIIFLFSKVKSGDTLISYNTHIGYTLGIMFLKIFKKITYIVEFEDFYNKSDYRYYINLPFEKVNIILADMFIASSSGVKSYIENHTKKKCLIHSGYRDIDNKIKRIKYEKGSVCSTISTDTTKIFYSGSLTKSRGILDLIKIFCEKKSNTHELFITGDGPLKEFVIEKDQQYSNIKYFGNLNEEEYKSLILKVDFCVNSQNPNINLNFPSKVTEYLSSGKVVLSTKGLSLQNSEFAP